MSDLTEAAVQFLVAGVSREDVTELLLIETHEEAGVDLPGT